MMAGALDSSDASSRSSANYGEVSPCGEPMVSIISI